MKRIFVLLVVVMTVALGTLAQSSRTPSRQCTFNGDCMDPLVCEGGYCRAQCASDRDCYAGWVCMLPTASGPLPPNGRPPGQDMNRCAPPGTPANPVVWNAQRNNFVPLPLPVIVAGTMAVASTPATAASTPQTAAGYAIPDAPATQRPVLQTPIVGLNPGVNTRRVLRAGGMEFQRGENDPHLYMRIEGGQWGRVGAGELASEPAVLATSAHAAYVFAKGNDNAIWGVFCQGGKCDDWFSLGGVLTSAPAASSQADGSLKVRATGSDGRPWFVVGDGTNWSAWNPE
jgi:hypothetical protein